MSHIIDVFDFRGDTWELMVPPVCYTKSNNEVWLMVRRTTAVGLILNYPMIPVPVFTDWFPVPMTDEAL